MTISDEILANPVLNSVQALLETQTIKGIAKYQNTVQAQNLTFYEWVQHASEEIIDLLVYLQTSKVKYEKLERDHENMHETLEVIASDTTSWTDAESRLSYIHKIAKEALEECII